MLLKDNPAFFQKAFLRGDNVLTFEIFNDNLRPRFSDEGTNGREKEMEIFEALLDYIEKVAHDGKLIFSITSIFA